jgi:hypothetical protein
MNFPSTFCALLLALLCAACVQQTADVGKKLEINGGDFYYTTNVTDTEVWKVVDVLTAAGFYREGGKTSAQLDRLRSIPHVRLVAQPAGKAVFRKSVWWREGCGGYLQRPILHRAIAHLSVVAGFPTDANSSPTIVLCIINQAYSAP